MVQSLDVAAYVGSHHNSSTKSRPVGDRFGVDEVAVGNKAVKTPFILVSELFNFSEFLFILSLVKLADLLKDVEASSLNAVIVIVQSRDNVREESTFMVEFIREHRKHLAHGHVEKLTADSGAISNKESEVVKLSGGLIEIFNWDNVRVTETDHAF